VLYLLLITLCRVMAPFTPFFTEVLYQNLRKLHPKEEREDSVHYLSFPTPRKEWQNEVIERAVSRMQAVIELGRVLRERRTKPLKIPLAQIVVFQQDKQYIEDLKQLESYILSEMNVKEVVYKETTSETVVKAVPDHRRLGTRFRKELSSILASIKELPAEELQSFEKTGTLTVQGHVLDSQDIKLVREFSGDSTRYPSACDESVLVVLDLKEDPALEQEGLVRQVINRIQRLRKAAGLAPSDANIAVYYTFVAADTTTTNSDTDNTSTKNTNTKIPNNFTTNSNAVQVAVTLHLEKIERETFTQVIAGHAPHGQSVLETGSSKVNDVKFELQLVRKS